MGRRTLLLLASILVAAAGTAMIWVYVQSADARAQATWIDRVTVLRATGQIDAGAGWEDVAAVVEPIAVPRGLVPKGAISDVKYLVGKAATMPVPAGEFLQSSQFGAEGSPSGVRSDRMAITINLGDANRVAGLLHPDSDVAVYFVPSGTGGGGGGGGGGAAKNAGQDVRVLLSKVHVIGLGNTTTVLNGRGQPAQLGTQSGVAAANVIVEVTDDEAKKLILAVASGGQLWFAVLGDKVAPRVGTTITLNDLLAQTAGAR